ncbi:unnamed protein product [Gordionus sp. m RMFG-2023]|uniref:uncharacterized protein LOC135931442 n=1 Tax=Gordionus sp. m RMFG-2023 TaxID=3053472 RepID=UPI0030DFF393
MNDHRAELDTNILNFVSDMENEREKVSSDSEESHISDKENSLQRLWNHFQMAAIAVSQLYKSCENINPSVEQEELWIPFQNASLAITSLYKEAVESQQKRFEIAFNLGQRKRTKEIKAWLSSVHSKSSQIKRNNNNYFNYTSGNNKRIKRDEMVAFLEYLDAKSGFYHKCKSLSPRNYLSSPRNRGFSSSPSPSPNNLRHRVDHANHMINQVQSEERIESSRRGREQINEELDVNNFVQALNMNGSPNSDSRTHFFAPDLLVPSNPNLSLDSRKRLFSANYSKQLFIKRHKQI